MFLAGLSKLDEVGILGEPTGIEEEWDLVLIADAANGLEVLETYRLSAAGIGCDGAHYHRYVAAFLFEHFL